MEKIVVVDQHGCILKFATKEELFAGDIVAVELVMMYQPESQKIILFNRGKDASDMHDHWALESGKVISEDLTSEDQVGRVLSMQAYKNAAVREFVEELNYQVSPEVLEPMDEFYFDEKHIYCTLLSFAIASHDIRKLTLNGAELDQMRQFSLKEFCNNEELGDAVVFRKKEIGCFLQKAFNGSL